MGSIGSAISSAFTAPGTNAAQAQQANNSSAQNTNLGLLNAWAPIMQQQMGNYSANLPAAQAAVGQLGQFTTQGGRNQMTNAFAANARGQAQTAAAQAPGQFVGNPALSQAYQLSAYNGANQSANQYAQQINSPQGMASAANSYIGAMNSLAPNFQGLNELNSGVYGAPRVQVGQGLLGTLGQMAGPVLGAVSGGMFGGWPGSGSGSSGQTNTFTPTDATIPGTNMNFTRPISAGGLSQSGPTGSMTNAIQQGVLGYMPNGFVTGDQSQWDPYNPNNSNWYGAY